MTYLKINVLLNWSDFPQVSSHHHASLDIKGKNGVQLEAKSILNEILLKLRCFSCEWHVKHRWT